MPNRFPTLILLTATVTACAPGQTSLLPHPESVAEGVAFTFKEWLPDGVPSFLEGQVAVTAHGFQVTTRQARCHERPSLPDNVQRDFDCGGVILSFSRDDPTLQATLRYTAMIPETTSQCGTALIYGEGGARHCPSSRVSTSYRRVERSGRLQLTVVE